MIPTPIGVVVILAGLWLLFRPAAEMLVFVLFCALFAGASALDMPVLGHSSMPPATLALVFLFGRMLKRDVRESSGPILGLRVNSWLLLFAVYGAVSAFVLPRIFADRVYVIPMQKSYGFSPLVPSSQNITQAVYLLGTAFASIGASAVVGRSGAASTFTRGLLLVTVVQIATGLLDAVASAAHLGGVLNVFRNGSYSQVDQEAGSFHRIAGLTPEASVYANLSIVFMVFSAELWLRGVSPRLTAPLALLMGMLILASTSSTGYVSIGVYALLLILRTILIPGAVSTRQALTLAALAIAAVALGFGIAVAIPHVGASLVDVVSTMTVKKNLSASAIERSLWARQGWDMFTQTRGLGVGVGSFRSSSLFTAILGSVGPACLLVFLVYCLQVFKPLRVSSYRGGASLSENVGAAAGWAALMQLVPSAISAAGADPGVIFGAMCGVSLALRAGVQSRALDHAGLPAPTTWQAKPDQANLSPLSRHIEHRA